MFFPHGSPRTAPVRIGDQDLGLWCSTCCPVGASVIECCYAASCTRLSLTMTQIVQRVSTDLTFSHASKRIVDEKISLNVSRRFVRPACMAGVLTSRPNFSAR